MCYVSEYDALVRDGLCVSEGFNETILDAPCSLRMRWRLEVSTTPSSKMMSTTRRDGSDLRVFLSCYTLLLIRYPCCLLTDEKMQAQHFICVGCAVITQRFHHFGVVSLQYTRSSVALLNS